MLDFIVDSFGCIFESIILLIGEELSHVSWIPIPCPVENHAVLKRIKTREYFCSAQVTVIADGDLLPPQKINLITASCI
jgi:hypothetical protein